MTEKEYGKLIKDMSPKSPLGKDCINAFWIGGLICTLGQVFIGLYTLCGLDKQDAGTAASMSLVVLSALFSSSETAFSSVNTMRIKNYAEEKVKQPRDNK